MQIKLIEFETIIFDLDFTIWDGCDKDFWAKKLQFPVRRENNLIIDNDGKHIKLQDGIVEILSFLKANNKKLGFLTRGGLLETEYSDQPSIKCLNLFGIFNMFNHQKTVLYRTDLKSKYIKPIGKTIFIDDNEIDLTDMKENQPNVFSLDRNSFNEWQDLL